MKAAVTPYNRRYLVTKRDRLGHQIQDLNEAERSVVPGHLNGHARAHEAESAVLELGDTA